MNKTNILRKNKKNQDYQKVIYNITYYHFIPKIVSNELSYFLRGFLPISDFSTSVSLTLNKFIWKLFKSTSKEALDLMGFDQDNKIKIIDKYLNEFLLTNLTFTHSKSKDASKISPGTGTVRVEAPKKIPIILSELPEIKKTTIAIEVYLNKLLSNKRISIMNKIKKEECKTNFHNFRWIEETWKDYKEIFQKQVEDYSIIFEKVMTRSENEFDSLKN